MDVTFGKVESDVEKVTEDVQVGLMKLLMKQGSFNPKSLRCPVASSISGVLLVPVGGFSKKYRPVPKNSQFVL
jgi:hypothetical protein